MTTTNCPICHYTTLIQDPCKCHCPNCGYNESCHDTGVFSQQDPPDPNFRSPLPTRNPKETHDGH
jgi:hypothetical protein